MIAVVAVLVVSLLCLLYTVGAFQNVRPVLAARRSSWGSSSSSSSLHMGALNSSPMELCEENAVLVIEEVRAELGTIFGYDAGSRSAGITGEIELVELDGPTMVVKLRGRFWHATDTVMMRVESFVKQRIPEVISVTLDLEKSSIQDDNRLNTGKLY